jgi:hypothetical protein
MFFALLFVLSTAASAAASVQRCCPDQDCGLGLCIAIGCAPALPIIAFDTPTPLAAPRATADYAPLPVAQPPSLVEDIWTPPD